MWRRYEEEKGHSGILGVPLEKKGELSRTLFTSAPCPSLAPLPNHLTLTVMFQPSAYETVLSSS